MRVAVVELDTGEQEFFEEIHEAFKYAKQKENERTHSVESLILVEDFDTFEPSPTILYGQELRIVLRSFDNLSGWLKSGTKEDDI